MTSAAHAEHRAMPAHRHGRPSQSAFRWEPPATRALLALTPFVSGGVAAALLNSFDWCHGEVRVTLAVCLVGAVASGTLLLCWSFDPASMRRSIAHAIAAGLTAAAPLLPFG